MPNDADHTRKLAELAFGTALQQLSAGASADLGPAADSNDTIESLIAEFESAAQHDEEGNEFWLARDLQALLGYSKWDNFLTVVSKAMAACAQAGHDDKDHFAGVGKMVSLGSGAEREIDDIVLSRYASYLVAQNGDGRKRLVAFAQTYFAIQTRRQEIAEQQAQEYLPLSEDERRILLRDEIKTHNKSLASATKHAGVREGASPQSSKRKVTRSCMAA